MKNFSECKCRSDIKEIECPFLTMYNVYITNIDKNYDKWWGRFSPIQKYNSEKLSANVGFHSLNCLFSMSAFAIISVEFELNFYTDQGQTFRASPNEIINI